MTETLTPREEFQPDYSAYHWQIIDLKRISYAEALELQQQTWNAVQEGGDHVLYLLEHNPVITMGRRTDPEHLLRSRSELKEDGIELFKVDRGGSATYHGPGQLVGYVICKSSRMGGIHTLVKRILNIITETIQSFGVPATIDEDNPGVWTETEVPRKLAAVGMSNTHGITMHGFAINVDLPLSGFSAIVPCGLTLPVTTMAIETGKHLQVDDVKTRLIEILKEDFKQEY